MRTTIRVQVPATTANLGPGFDALGLALGLYNTIVAEPAPALEVLIEGEGAQTLPRDASNVMVRAIAHGCQAAGVAMPALRLTCQQAIPAARGLGSSASAAVAGLLVADALAGGALGRARVLEMATEMEGHPDNAAPAVFGGLQACVMGEAGRVHRVTVPVPVWPEVALFVPDFPMHTDKARAVLPPSISRAGAVYNISRTALLVAALAAGDLEALSVATEDALHQRPREAMFPAMGQLFRAAREAGALGAWLSGAGSTVAAFAPRGRAGDVARAMERAAREADVSGRAVVTFVDTEGATVG